MRYWWDAGKDTPRTPRRCCARSRRSLRALARRGPRSRFSRGCRQWHSLRLVQSAGMPVVPCWIEGSCRVHNKADQKATAGGVVRATFGSMISAEEAGAMKTDEFLQRIFTEIATGLGQADEKTLANAMRVGGENPDLD